MKKALSLLVLALAVFALAACGSDNGTTTEAEPEAPSGAAAGESEAGGEAGGEAGAEAGGAAGGEAGGASSSIEIEADPSGALSYTEEEVTAEAGNVTIAFSNPAPVGHDVTVEAEGG